MLINVASMIRGSAVEGFGYRYCIWVQGCPHKCAGCANEHMWDFGAGENIEVDAIISEIAGGGYDGVTILGGEPFSQPEAVSAIASGVRKSGKSVIIFTGYIFAELAESDNPDYADIIRNTDLLVDGKYDKEKRLDNHPFIGSSNQNMIFLNADFKKHYRTADTGRKFEIRVSKNGLVQVNGMYDDAVIKRIFEEIWG